jgi:hypothetical protein
VVGETRTETIFSLDIGQHFGDTRFESHWPSVDGSGELVTGGSELIFPLDFPTIGLGFRMMGKRGDLVRWTFSGRVCMALSNPGDKMIDRDWFDTDGHEEEFSWTESTVDGSWRELEIEATRVLVAETKWDLALLVGASYQKTKQKMIDVAGWRSIPDSADTYHFSLDTLAGTYEISYFRPQIGLMPRLFLGSKMTLEVKGVMSPFLKAKEIDDHVLRSFQIRTEGRGLGYSGRVALVYSAGGRAESGLFIRLEGEYSRAEVDVSGWREYYADGEGGLIEAGSVWPEEHEVSSTQYAIRLALAIRL